MPDFDHNQGRDLAWLAIAFLIVILTVIPLSELLIAAWNAEGIVYTFVYDLTNTYGINIDLFVVVPTGFLVGWLALFSLDDTKRIQAVILVFAIIPFALILQSQEVWSEYVAWIDFLPFAGLGVLFGIVTGASDKILYGLQHREFPIAAHALFLTTAVTLLAAFIDLSVSSSVQVFQTVTYGGSVLLFVGLFGSFVQYTNRRDVIIFTPGGYRDAEATLVTGLYDTAKSRYETRVSKGANDLNEAQAKLAQNSEPDPFPSTIQFRFKPPGLFSRWATVNADGYDLQNLYEDEFTRAIEGIQPPKSTPSKLLRLIQQVLPTIGRKKNLGHRIRSADLLVLVVPLSDSRIRSPMKSDTLAESTPPDYLKMYNQLCKAAGGSTDTLVATVDSEIAVNKYQDQRGIEVDLSSSDTSGYQQFEFELREWLGELLADSENHAQPMACSIVPLCLDTIGDDDESNENVFELLLKVH
jgi:hypothetical protein